MLSLRALCQLFCGVGRDSLALGTLLQDADIHFC